MSISNLLGATLLFTAAALSPSALLHAETTTPNGRHTISYDNGALLVESIDKFTKLKKRVLHVNDAQFSSLDETLTKMKEWRDVAEKNEVKNFDKSKRMVWGQKGNTQAIDFKFQVNAKGQQSVYVVAKFGPHCNDPSNTSIVGCNIDTKSGSGILNFDDIEAIHAALKDIDSLKAAPKTDDLFK